MAETHPTIQHERRSRWGDGHDAKFCYLCGHALVVVPVVHKTMTTLLDPYGRDRLIFCTCGWRFDAVTTVQHGSAKAQEEQAIAAHMAENPWALCCPNEERARAAAQPK